MENKPQGLVVEDNPAQAEIFTAALENAGYEVVWIDNGSEAMAYLEKNAPAVVVLDLHLPEVAGSDILTHIRSQPHLAETRVMLATADPRMAEMVASESDLVLLKPVSYVQLRELARRLLVGGTKDN